MNPPGLEGQIAVVTGATGGMGQVIAVELARRGAQVVTVSRSTQRVHTLRRRITQAVGVDRLEVIVGDLSRRTDLLAAARSIVDLHPEVHLLVNNAGAHFSEHRLSADGVEMHIAVDYLAAYGLTTLLDGALRRGQARVVNVASDTLNDTRQIKLARRPRPATLDLTGVTDVRQLNPQAGFRPFQAYATAKLMTVTAGYDLAHRFAPDGVTVNSLHPGIVATAIIDDLMPKALRPFSSLIRRSMLSPEDGADVAIRLATDPTLAGTTGRYFNRDREAATPAVSHDRATRAHLRRLSDTYLAPSTDQLEHR